MTGLLVVGVVSSLYILQHTLLLLFFVYINKIHIYFYVVEQSVILNEFVNDSHWVPQ
jgi:hypothetical protein